MNWWIFAHFSYRTCYRRCLTDCSSGGPFTLQYKLLTLPFGIPPNQDVVRLSAFSEGGVLQNQTSFTAVEQDLGSPFALRDDGGHGIIYTLRSLDTSGVYRIKVQATSHSKQGLQYQNVFIIYISVSPYPYWFHSHQLDGQEPVELRPWNPPSIYTQPPPCKNQKWTVFLIAYTMPVAIREPAQTVRCWPSPASQWDLFCATHRTEGQTTLPPNGGGHLVL